MYFQFDLNILYLC